MPWRPEIARLPSCRGQRSSVAGRSTSQQLKARPQASLPAPAPAPAVTPLAECGDAPLWRSWSRLCHRGAKGHL